MPTTRRRHFGSVRKLPSGRYQVRYWQEGESHTAPVTFRAKADALAWLSATEADLLRGEWVKPRAGKVTLDEYAEEWLGRQSHLRPRTVELYRHLLDHYLLPDLGKRALSELKVGTISAWHDQVLAQAPGTAPKAYRLLAQVMSAAVKEERVQRSPCTLKGASSEARTERPVPTVAEVEALAAVVDGRYRAMVLLAAWCSLRFGELAALRRGRVDLAQAEVDVTETVVELSTGECFAGPPKTAAGRRRVAVPPHLLPTLREHLDQVAGGSAALLFPSPLGGYLRRNNFRQRVWGPALSETGFGYRFHDLRHAGLTWAAESGATVAELMHRAGHASSAAAMLYQHASRYRDQALARALSALSEDRTGERNAMVARLPLDTATAEFDGKPLPGNSSQGVSRASDRVAGDPLNRPDLR
jgi:integrase